MVVLPLLEALLRGTLHTGIAGAALIVQHLALVAGMLGGMVAAREGRLLMLSTLGESMLRGRFRTGAGVIAGAIGSMVAAVLAIASYQFVASEQRFGKALVYGIPAWAIELALPIGFAVIAGRLAYRASATWRGRLMTVLLGVAMGTSIVFVPDAPSRLFVPALGLVALASVLGTPAFVTLGGTALILFWRTADPTGYPAALERGAQSGAPRCKGTGACRGPEPLRAVRVPESRRNTLVQGVRSAP